ncbi:MAG: hypothetical protein DYH13_05345 [Alphaproteobacteria bacterium PRO2]|nr:hypothetical protein [Alphaproteobacteria bacterium PRO2]
MVDDKIHPKGSGPDKVAPEEENSTDPSKYYRNLHLADGGHTSFAHLSIFDKVEQEEKRRESRDFLRSLLNQAFIDDLERRNNELLDLIMQTEENLQNTENEREAALSELKDAERKLTTSEHGRDQAEKILEEVQRQQDAADDLVQQAQADFPDNVLTDDMVQLTFKLDNGKDRPHVADVQVAVYKENGKYYFTNPLTGLPQEVSEEQQKEILKQLKEGKKTYDELPGDVKHKIDHHYNGAAHNFILHALHADQHRAELEKAQEDLETKRKEYIEQRDKVSELKQKIREIDSEIEELKNKKSTYKSELKENEKRLEILYAEREALHEQKISAKKQLRENRKELRQSLEANQEAAAKYFEAAQAQSDYSKKALEAWKNYQDCKSDEKTLQQMGIAVVDVVHQDPAHPGSHAHMVHTVHRDESGYYYLDAHNLRQDLSADSIRPGTKAVEDLAGDEHVQKAVLLYDQKADKFHTTLHEFEKLSHETESFINGNDDEKPESSTHTYFSNEKPMTGLTETGVFAEAAGRPYTAPHEHEHGLTAPAIPLKKDGPAT